MNPELPPPPLQDAAIPAASSPVANAPTPRSTASKLLGLLIVVVCFEVGVFLMVFPWMDAWTKNWFPTVSVQLLDLWESNYFRGALTGLGAINIYISFQEMMRLLRGE